MIKNLALILYRAYLGLSLACFSLLALIVGWQVFARYVLNNTPSWSEPLSLLLLLNAVLLGTACGVKEDGHLSLLWFKQRFPSKIQTVFTHAQHVIVLTLGASMLIYGQQMASITWRYQIPGLDISMGIQYLPLVFSGLGIVVFSIERLLLFKAKA